MTTATNPDMETSSMPPPSAAGRQTLTIERIFDAPRELVWKVWTDPKHAAQWWKPKYFTNPVCEMDVQPGGAIRIDMRAPDGAVYPMKGLFHEIIEPERLVFTSGALEDAKGNPQLETFNTVTFTEHEGKTKLTLDIVVTKAAPAAEGALAGMEEGWNQSLDSLAEILANQQGGPIMAKTTITAEPGKQEVVITRTFDAPRDLVFKTITDPTLVPQWWGPKRFTTIVDRMEMRPGGIWRYIQRDAEGNEYAFHGVYHEIVSPERIVQTFEFEGVPGHVSLETVMLEEQNGKTKWTSTAVFQSLEDRDGMVQSGMEGGAIELMDRLAELVEKS